MSAIENVKLDALGRMLLSPEIILAALAFFAFSSTIIQPDNILPTGLEGRPSKKEKIIYSADVLELAKNSEAVKLLEAGKPDLAIKKAGDMVEAKPHDVVAIMAAGNVFVDAGMPEEGFKLLKRAVALAPRSRYVRLNLAEKLADKGNYDEAIAQYNMIVQGYSHWADPHLRMADIYMKTGRPQDAAAALEKALEIEPNNGAARKLRGLALARAGQGRKGFDEYFMGESTEVNFQGLPADVKQQQEIWGSLERAMFQLRQELNLRPKDAPTKLLLARMLYYTGQPAEAKPLLLEARKAAPSDPDVHRNLSMVLHKLGENNLALSEFMLSVNLEKAREKARQEK